jgi:hypothetical protein
VALKWSDIDDQYIFIERSRVKNREKEDLKTADSRRAIEIRPSMQTVFAAAEKPMTASIKPANGKRAAE